MSKLAETLEETLQCNIGLADKICELQQRVGELRDWKKITDTAGKKLAEDNIRLRKALEIFGMHLGGCSYPNGCTCGLNEALKESE